jgi:hypothetical protein
MRSMVEGGGSAEFDQLPLHHPSGGPPPPTGEERVSAIARDHIRPHLSFPELRPPILTT